MLEPAPGIDLEMTFRSFGEMANGLIQKDRFDLMRYDHIIRGTSPDLVIETGTDTGHSAAWFADNGCDVITIDVDPTKRKEKDRPDVMYVIGDSTSPEVGRKIRALASNYDRVMVSLDSDHSREHVEREIYAYADLVTPGCYLVIEDGIFSLLPEGFDKGYNADAAVLEAISAVMPARSDFVRDVALEGLYPVTGSPAGWWRRS